MRATEDNCILRAPCSRQHYVYCEEVTLGPNEARKIQFSFSAWRMSVGRGLLFEAHIAQRRIPLPATAPAIPFENRW